MSVVLALPDKDTIAHLEFEYEDHGIEGWPNPRGGFDVWVDDPEGNEYQIGHVEEPTEVRPLAVGWVDKPPEERFYKGVHVRSKRKPDNIYQVMAVKANGRLVLYRHGSPRIRNAKPESWEVVG